MTRLYLVRHGETEHNASNIVQGTLDTKLNSKGQQQARLVAERLKLENIDALYSSSLIRAKTTAQIISECINIPVTELHELREICLGSWQGLTLDEIKLKYKEHYRTYTQAPASFNLDGAETILQVSERFKNAVIDIVAQNKDKNIVLVSHGAAIKAAIVGILGIDIDHYNKFRIDNSSISILNFSEKYYGGVIVHSMNDTNHLK